MIKNNKKAFTLAELLIAIAIISIVSAMGLVISKKGMERAFDYYIYNSYKSISIAINNAILSDYSLSNFADFSEKIHKTFGPSSEFEHTSDTATIKVENGVKYTLKKINNKLLIIVEVPSSNNGSILGYLYDTNKPELGLIPASDSNYSNKLIVMDRVDLLPFIIDDGESGRVINRLKDDGSGFEIYYSPSNNEKYSYRDAFCRAYRTTHLPYNNSFSVNDKIVQFTLNCNGINGTLEGVIKHVDPKKVF